MNYRIFIFSILVLFLSSCASNNIKVSDYQVKPPECFTVSEPIEISVIKNLKSPSDDEDSRQMSILIYEHNKLSANKFTILNKWDETSSIDDKNILTHFTIQDFSCDPKLKINNNSKKIFTTSGNVEGTDNSKHVSSWHSPNKNGETFSVSYDNRGEVLSFYVSLKLKSSTSVMFASVDAGKPVMGKIKLVDKDKNLYSFFISNDDEGSDLIYAAMNGDHINVTLKEDVKTHKFMLKGFSEFISSRLR